MNETFTFACQENELVGDDVVAVQVQGTEVALFEKDGEIFATSNRCTHGEARLSDGFFDGTEIECPLHQGRFDVRTGAPTCAPCTQPIQIYPVRREDGKVFVDLG
jgi:naphthalene 1,2-dioxygenase ferredoxin component